MLLGFLLASYSIVANDAIQTLGTFLSSNAHRPWWVLWLFAASILTVVLVFGWATSGGDVSYGRLTDIPYPASGGWLLILPPLTVLVLTRFGAPVSTTFLILGGFAPRNLGAMLVKSGVGYLVAFGLAIAIYAAIARLEGRFLGAGEAEADGEDIPTQWVVLQWMSTAWLWGNWLIQDLANIFAYLPRRLPLAYLLASLLVMLALQAVLFARRGGEIQKIVTSKTNLSDIRSATIVDFLYGIVLFVFKSYSNVPMSTTWVFLGLLAGREIVLAYRLGTRRTSEVGSILAIDLGKATLGLVVSVALALLLDTFRA
jgi:phosphate/sulfate permease